MNSVYNRATKVLNLLLANGGKGSGNWGHSGRPGLVGGSAAGGGRSSKSKKSRRSSKSKSSEPSVIEPTKIEVGGLPDSTDKTGKYTEAEKRAVERYVSGDMMWVNQYLRGRMPDDVVLQPDEKKFIEDLKSATSKPISKDMTLYRSVDARAVFGDITPLEFSNLVNYVVYGDTQRLIARDAIRLLERAEDSEITEKGFMSTTKDKDTATGWGDFTGSDKPVVVELKVPKGTKGVDLGEAMPELDKLMGQSEVLLHPGVTYRITGFRVDDGLIFTADVEGQQNNRLEVAKEDFAKYLNGGKGSGNWGHAGRPGLVGGSRAYSGGRNGFGSGLARYLNKVKKPMTDSDMAKLFGKKHTFKEWGFGERMEVNPDYGSKPEYRRNCQMVVPSLEASMRGYKVKAKPRTEITNTAQDADNLSWHLADAAKEPKMFCHDFWDGADGKPAKDAKGEATYRAPHRVSGQRGWKYPDWTKSERDALQKHIESYPKLSRMQISFNYTGKSGHTTMLLRVSKDVDPNGYVIIEGQPSNPKIIPSDGYFDNKGAISLMRIDDKPFNGAYINAVMERRDEK